MKKLSTKLAMSALIIGSASPFTPLKRVSSIGAKRPSTVSHEEQSVKDTQARKDLEVFAAACNPQIEYFDPLGLADQQFWGLR